MAAYTKHCIVYTLTYTFKDVFYDKRIVSVTLSTEL